jgi:hypothetical protein
MRTTLDIEEDVLVAAKELARKERTTAGQVISRLARMGLTGEVARTTKKFARKNGLPVFPPDGEIVTNELINRIRDEEGI